jgi:hypothetical protein
MFIFGGNKGYHSDHPVVSCTFTKITHPDYSIVYLINQTDSGAQEFFLHRNGRELQFQGKKYVKQ